MIKFIVWAMGNGAILFTIDHFHVWREAIAACLVACGLLWIVGGAIALAGSVARPATSARPTLAKEDIERIVREQYARRERFGEVSK